MNRLTAIALVLLTLEASVAQIQRPNVIMVIVEQLRYASCGYAGDKQAITPNIDRLAAQGISFDNYVVNTPVSGPNRATLWTGQYASTHGMVVNELRLNPNHDALAHLLTEKGYSCDYIGQWHLWANQTGRHKFTENAFCPPGPYRLGFDGFWAAYNVNHHNFHAFYFRDTATRKEITGWAPVLFTDMAINRIERHAETRKPFAMVVSYSPPHSPWTKDNVSPWWYDRFADVEFELPSISSDTPDGPVEGNPNTELPGRNVNLPENMRVYYAMTAALDEQLGRLLQALEEHQLANNTVVIFTSGHGEQFGADTRMFRTTFFDKSVRVPMLMRWPGKIPAQRRSNACMSAVDVMPTICGMLGVRYPDTLDGIDLSDSTRVDCSCEPDFAFLQGMGHTSEWKDGFEWLAIRDQRFTYARYLVDGQEQLFDNVSDPDQVRNLINVPESFDDRQRLRQWLTEKMLATLDEFKPGTWYRDHWTENRVILRGARGEFHRELDEDVEVDVTLKSSSQ